MFSFKVLQNYQISQKVGKLTYRYSWEVSEKEIFKNSHVIPYSPHRNPQKVFTLQDTFCPGFIFEVDRSFNIFITRYLLVFNGFTPVFIIKRVL